MARARPAGGLSSVRDPRVERTVDAVCDRLAVDDAFVRRYDGDDGLPGEEGALALRSCWLVDALALSGEVEAARDRCRELLDLTPPLGLLAEGTDPATGAQLGNFPQAFSPVGLVNSAVYLGHADGYEAPDPPPIGVRLGDPTGLDG